MSVIAELSVASDEFELGRVLNIENEATIVLETMVPLGEKPVPFFRVHDEVAGDFERSIREQDSVDSLELINQHGNESLYSLDWNPSDNSLLDRIHSLGATLLEARGTHESWLLEVRFESHDDLAELHDTCDDAGVELEVERVYNPTKPGAGPWFGVTASQREALVEAVERGYYSIPRGVSTTELGESLGISDQAVTERLRRGIVNLVSNTLMTSDGKD